VKGGIGMDDLLTMTAAEIAYLSSAWPEAMSSRVHNALGIRDGRSEEVLLAGLGSLLERRLVTETDAEPGYAPGAEARVAMLGLYCAQATIEFATVIDRHLHSMAVFIGPELRLGALAASAGRFALGLYPADVDWGSVLVDGIGNALGAAPDALTLLQFRSSTGALERIAIRTDTDGRWLVSDSAESDASFRPTNRAEVAQSIATALAGIGLEPSLTH